MRSTEELRQLFREYDTVTSDSFDEANYKNHDEQRAVLRASIEEDAMHTIRGLLDLLRAKTETQTILSSC